MKENFLELVGNTPLYHLKNSSIYLKLEYFNPTGSVKDRAAKQMLMDAIENGQLHPGMKVVEATSGNMGIALTAIGKSLGFDVILAMPESMSAERKQLLKCYGANLILTPKEKGMKGAIEAVEKFQRENPSCYVPHQFENLSNPKAHYRTTAEELWSQLDEKIDVLVAGIGTGGTIMGIGKFLKEKNKSSYIVGVEPASSPILTKGYSGTHKIQGIGAGFIPPLLDEQLLDEVISVSDEEAYSLIECLVKEEGLFLGPSSGAALFAAQNLAKREDMKGKNIVVICPDSINKYLSLLK